MRQYLDLCKHVLENGVIKKDRTGTGTISVFGYQMRFDLSNGFPLLTTKFVNYEKVLGELLWFISGNTNANVCAEKYGFKTWKLWADEDGELGPIYGAQWRRWAYPTFVEYGGHLEFDEMGYEDQLQWVIDEIKRNPNSRRLIVSAWNVGQLHEMALPPCHLLFQFYVANGRLSCQLYQRSADIFLGVPFNIASYSTLIHMICALTDLQPGEFIHTLGDAHIYLNHIEQVKLQMEREPRELPQLVIKRKVTSIDDFKMDDFEIVGYNPHPAIKGEVSV
jgi:thymidylate synthase